MNIFQQQGLYSTLTNSPILPPGTPLVNLPGFGPAIAPISNWNDFTAFGTASSNSLPFLLQSAGLLARPQINQAFNIVTPFTTIGQNPLFGFQGFV
jgi:hypothetical protein